MLGAVLAIQQVLNKIIAKCDMERLSFSFLLLNPHTRWLYTPVIKCGPGAGMAALSQAGCLLSPSCGRASQPPVIRKGVGAFESSQSLGWVQEMYE